MSGLGHEDHVSAILLAAGRSERMGAFKPLLPFGNTSVIESCINYLRQAGINDIVVVVGYRADDIKSRLKDSEVTLALNPDPASQMSASIAHGIKQLSPSAHATLIALTDQPAVPPSVVKLLVAQWRDGNLIIKPEFKGRGGHPVLIDLRYANELMTLDPELGLKSFFRAHQETVRRIPVDSPFVARDMDTWDDYAALHRDVFGFGPALPSET